jgi:uncharacterized protein YdeI (BOF family)
MKRKKAILIRVGIVVTVVCCLAGFSATAAAAESTTSSTGATATTAVSEDTSTTEAAAQLVTFIGTIIQALGGNEYVVQGADGTITIDAGPFWYKVLSLVVGQNVTITGELDTGKDGTSAAQLDVFTVSDDKGAVIATVREGSGRPPWAGGPFKNGVTPGHGVPDNDPNEAPEAPDAD